ncbi:Ubiquitin-conjugating enzyme UBE2Q [Fasciolopsis buskii]|uniref:Ubiquitin-conjugating enzyme UBE2Q n=1 Tax=Fasciolopsis buskii TaxID=27845 RepID=A0A8E0VEU6_9TREM|nr:Ubiquitin-conjugating enzyme UBE2Q [Fasciolopsis buski]
MSCIKKLKDSQQTLLELFPKDHPVFRIDSCTLDEISCKFVCTPSPVEITGSLQDTYPRYPPIWFSDSEDPILTRIFDQLRLTDAVNFTVDRQVKMLVIQLCRYKHIDCPPELERLCPDFDPQLPPPDSAIPSESPPASPDPGSDPDDTGFEDEDVPLNDAFDDSVSSDDRSEYDGISSQDAERLEKLRANQLQLCAEGVTKGGMQSSVRLMKELRDIYRSESYKQGVFTVEMQDDSLYDWKVKLYKVDQDSELSKDLQALSNHPSLEDHIGLQFLFKDTYPYEPPFVRIIYPIIEKGYVQAGGAICMELLTKQGWSSAYDIESVIMQLAATLVKGCARINFNASQRLLHRLPHNSQPP